MTDRPAILGAGPKWWAAVERSLHGTGLAVRCVECGGLSTGRYTVHGWGRGDRSLRLPRLHTVDGARCKGSFFEAEWLTVGADGAIEDDSDNPDFHDQGVGHSAT